MGVCISYRCRLSSVEVLPRLCEELRGLAEERGWKHVEIPAPSPDAAEGVDASAPGEPPPDLSGIAITTHEKCEPLLLLFDRVGSLRNPVLAADDEWTRWCAVKTQYAPPEAHVAVIGILKQLEKSYLAELDVVDEGQYWDTMDLQLLIANLKAVGNLLDAVGDALKHAPRTGDLEQDIIDAISKKLGSGTEPD